MVKKSYPALQADELLAFAKRLVDLEWQYHRTGGQIDSSPRQVASLETLRGTPRDQASHGEAASREEGVVIPIGKARDAKASGGSDPS